MNNLDVTLQISNSNISNNQAKSSSIIMLYTTALISNTTFTDNYADKVSHGITLINSQLTTSNVTVNYTNPQFLNSTTTLSPDSGFFNVNYQSTLTMTNNTVLSNCRGKLAAAIYATGSSNVYGQSGTSIVGGYSSNGQLVSLQSTDTASFDSVYFSNNPIINIYVNSASLSVNNSVFDTSNSQFINGEIA